jgi:TATA-box binding protein (TBP) (component of TFIID and TFIIIB)
MNEENNLISIQAIKQQLIKELEYNKKPDDVNISTMTIVCKMNTNFLCGNIARYIKLSFDGVLGVTHGINGDPSTNRTLIQSKKITNKKKKHKNVFFNQVSMYLIIKTKINPINVKIFSNGAIQMTGCKTIQDALETLIILLPKLQNVRAIVDYKNKKIIEKPFAEDIQQLNFENITNFKIAMINSNFNIPFEINRSKLYQLMLEENYDCLYDPIKHACVNIKYEHPDKSISIFVFEKGSIIITGSKNCDQINCAYEFINKYLLKNYVAIVKNNNLTSNNIINYIR